MVSRLIGITDVATFQLCENNSRHLCSKVPKICRRKLDSFCLKGPWIKLKKSCCFCNFNWTWITFGSSKMSARSPILERNRFYIHTYIHTHMHSYMHIQYKHIDKYTNIHTHAHVNIYSFISLVMSHVWQMHTRALVHPFSGLWLPLRAMSNKRIRTIWKRFYDRLWSDQGKSWSRLVKHQRIMLKIQNWAYLFTKRKLILESVAPVPTSLHLNKPLQEHCLNFTNTQIHPC